MEAAEKTEQLSDYELGFHITPEVDNAELKSSVEQIQNLLSSRGGHIVFLSDPRKVKLSYPINHKSQAYFGVLNFNASPQIIAELNKELKLQEKILRFIVLKREEGERILKTSAMIKNKDQVKSAVTKIKKEPKKVKPEEMEKQIEEVIEKL